jgi:recombinational DNA repair protein RecR
MKNMNTVAAMLREFTADLVGADDERTTCINCGKPSEEFLCQSCVDAGDRLEKLLREGISIGYSDGTTETIKG